MKSTQVTETHDKKWYRVMLVLLVGLASFSSAMKELNQFQELTREAGQFMNSWQGSLGLSANAGTPAKIHAPDPIPRNNTPADESYSIEPAAAGAAIDIQGVDLDMAEKATAGDVRVVILKESRPRNINGLQLDVVKKGRVATVCAHYPSEDTIDPNEWKFSAMRKRHQRRPVALITKCPLDFKVRVPLRVESTERVLNSEMLDKS